MRWLSSATFIYRRVYNRIEFQRTIGTGAWGDPSQDNFIVVFITPVVGSFGRRDADPAASVEQPG